MELLVTDASFPLDAIKENPKISKIHSPAVPEDGEKCLLTHPIAFCIVGQNQRQVMALCDTHAVPYALYGVCPERDTLIFAMNSGCCGFLSAPPEPEQLDVVIERMAELANRKAQLRLYQTVSEEVFWTNVINYKVPNTKEGLLAEAARFNILSSGPIQPLYIRYRDADCQWLKTDEKGTPDGDIELWIRKQIKDTYFREFFGTQFIPVSPHQFLVLIFIQSVENPHEKIRTSCEHFLGDCAQRNIHALCLMGDPAELFTLAGQCERLMRIGEGQVYLDNQFLPSQQAQHPEEEPPQPNAKRYLTLLDNGMYEEAREELRGFFYTPAVMPKVDRNFLSNFCYQLCDGFRELRLVRKTGVNLLQNFTEGSIRSASNTVQDFLAFFDVVAEELSFLSDSENEHQNLIEEVKIFVQEHLELELSREMVAGHFFLSADYLDRLFKREAGQTLTDYILHARITMAKRLLENPALLVTDISSTVGFVNPSHFSSAFKKVTGVSPHAYRKQISNI